MGSDADPSQRPYGYIVTDLSVLTNGDDRFCQTWLQQDRTLALLCCRAPPKPHIVSDLQRASPDTDRNRHIDTQTVAAIKLGKTACCLDSK